MVLDSSSVAREAPRALPWHSALPALLPTVVAAAGLFSLLLLVQMGGVTSTGYDLRQLEEARADWQSNNYLLEAYIADLQSLDRIEQQAKDRLGMVPAGTRIYVQVQASPQEPLPVELPPSHKKLAAVVSAAGSSPHDTERTPARATGR